jgi:hypothetical protein
MATHERRFLRRWRSNISRILVGSRKLGRPVKLEGPRHRAVTPEWDTLAPERCGKRAGSEITKLTVAIEGLPAQDLIRSSSRRIWSITWNATFRGHEETTNRRSCAQQLDAAEVRTPNGQAQSS